MGIKTLASALAREHREIDGGIESFTSGSRAGDALSLSGTIQALRRHIYLEEEFLFPPLRGGTPELSETIGVMVREHGQLWDLLDQLELEIVDNRSSETTRRLCRRIFAKLAPHHEKEEELLYTAADNVLEKPAEVRLRGFLAYAKLPEGWACSASKTPNKSSFRPAAYPYRRTC